MKPITENNLPVLKARAAALIAEDQLRYEQIAIECRTTKRTLIRWTHEATFQAAIGEQRGRLKQLLVDERLASKDQRLAALAASLQRLETVRAERAADPQLQDAPGGRTGLVVRRIKTLHYGNDDYREIVEYPVDYRWVRDQLAILEQAAKELGQWQNQNTTRFRRLQDMSEEELALLVADGVEEFGSEAVDGDV